MQITSGESRELKLRLLGHRLVDQDTARLAFVTNDPAGRDYFLRLEMRQATAYPGWVVIDLGTSNTCAALVDANQSTEMVVFEREQVEPTNLPSVICYLELARQRLYEVGTWAWERSTHPAAARSVVVAAKRYLGDEHRFEVVPVDEPAETFELAAEEVVTDLLLYTLKSATEMLLRRDTSAVVLNRVLICHPSRFSVHQIEELKEAVTRAQRRLLGSAQELEEPRTLQEPIGAALHFLNRWESHAWVHQQRNSDEADYSLLVYDFGGGTLDITLVKVRSRRRVRDASGGSAGLSERLTDWVRDRCEELAGPRYQVTSDQAEANDYLIDKFVASMVAALGGGESVEGLRDNPLVGDKLTLTLERDGEEVEKSFARARLLEQ
ncbi:MAG: Hsp70 family protein, partial [Candidatus Eremiobacteraeota bacterium]|nr:Hsp70 family protein [Candidatus Eremiobacteraeota bacterium]